MRSAELSHTSPTKQDELLVQFSKPLDAKMLEIQQAGGAPTGLVNLAFPTEAQILFLYEIEKRVPDVLRDLRSKWREYSLAVDPFTSATLHQITDTWAAGCYLTVNGKAPYWLHGQACFTMREWVRRPGRADIEPLTWPVAPARPERSDFLGIPIAPDYLPRKQRQAAMLRAAKEIIDSFLRQTPEARTPEHIVWLVRYQIKGEPLERIAKHPSDRPYSVTITQVKNALRRSAKVVEIDLIPFPQHKTGRPKKLESRIRQN